MSCHVCHTLCLVLQCPVLSCHVYSVLQFVSSGCGYLHHSSLLLRVSYPNSLSNLSVLPLDLFPVMLLPLSLFLSTISPNPLLSLRLFSPLPTLILSLTFSPPLSLLSSLRVLFSVAVCDGGCWQPSSLHGNHRAHQHTLLYLYLYLRYI